MYRHGRCGKRRYAIALGLIVSWWQRSTTGDNLSITDRRNQNLRDTNGTLKTVDHLPRSLRSFEGCRSAKRVRSKFSEETQTWAFNKIEHAKLIAGEFLLLKLDSRLEPDSPFRVQ